MSFPTRLIALKKAFLIALVNINLVITNSITSEYQLPQGLIHLLICVEEGEELAVRHIFITKSGHE